jgi:hypothetical protein
MGGAVEIAMAKPETAAPPMGRAKGPTAAMVDTMGRPWLCQPWEKPWAEIGNPSVFPERRLHFPSAKPSSVCHSEHVNNDN